MPNLDRKQNTFFLFKNLFLHSFPFMTRDAISSKRQPLEKLPLNASDWVYKSEGKEGIVFSYIGKDSALVGWVLRLVKQPSDGGASSPTKEQPGAELQRKQNAAIFSQHVMGSLIGTKYVLPQRLLQLSGKFLRQLDHAASPLRCKYSPLGTDRHIDINNQHIGVLTSDMLLLNSAGQPSLHTCSITVELKAKQIFKLPFSIDGIDFGYEYLDEGLCSFCMRQIYAQAHQERQESRFCPLDLYSGERARVAHAMDCLAQSPLTNLQVFVNGHGVLDENNHVSEQCVPQWERLKRAIIDIILTDPLFPHLQNLQQKMGTTDVTDIYPVYMKCMERDMFGGNEPSIDDWLEVYKSFKRRKATNSSNTKQTLLEYMLCKALRGLSVLITIPSWPMDYRAIDAHLLPKYEIAAVDLGPKKISRIPGSYALRQQVRRYYLEQTATSKNIKNFCKT